MPTLAERLAGLTGDFSDTLIHDVANVARPLETSEDLTPILSQIGNARYVLLGEASHGTHEYHTWRHRLTARLIREKGFRFVAVEGDWPDCYKVNRYVKSYAETPNDAIAALKTFRRWPTWMWANREIVHLVQWLREYNDALGKTEPAVPKIGFYGLDVYSLRESMESVIRFLERVDPQAAQKARETYGCFEPYSDDGQEYAWATTFVPSSCEEAAIAMLSDLRRNAKQYGCGEGIEGQENGFAAEQNALVVRDAEAYYRTMVRPGPDSWNVRDRHMVETLERLMAFHGPDAKAIVWEHNTHVGDARATDMARDGMVNVGQLVREAHAAEGVYIVGFGSYRGSVIAGEAWKAPMQIMEVPPARQGSWEDVMHRATEGRDALFLLDELGSRNADSYATRGHRAIGVVYHPERERFGNYVPTVLPQRYDAFLYVDRTHHLNPLHLKARHDGDLPETYPFAE